MHTKYKQSSTINSTTTGPLKTDTNLAAADQNSLLVLRAYCAEAWEPIEAPPAGGLPAGVPARCPNERFDEGTVCGVPAMGRTVDGGGCGEEPPQVECVCPGAAGPTRLELGPRSSRSLSLVSPPTVAAPEPLFPNCPRYGARSSVIPARAAAAGPVTAWRAVGEERPLCKVWPPRLPATPMAGVPRLLIPPRLPTLALRAGEECGDLPAAADRGLGSGDSPMVPSALRVDAMRYWSAAVFSPGCIASVRNSSGL